MDNDTDQCWGSVTFWYRFGSADPYLWLLDLDPTLSSVTLRMQKKNFLPPGTLSLVLTLNPYLWLMDPNPDPVGPKTCRSCGYGYPTLILIKFLMLKNKRCIGCLIFPPEYFHIFGTVWAADWGLTQNGSSLGSCNPTIPVIVWTK